MNMETMQKLWKKTLIEEGLSETEFFKQNGMLQPAGNRKIRTGSIKFTEFTDYMELLGYEISFTKKS